ncbi:MAG: OprO/OprP family phosphate-selective porin [Thermoguttaceae bacterium]
MHGGTSKGWPVMLAVAMLAALPARGPAQQIQSSELSDPRSGELLTGTMATAEGEPAGDLVKRIEKLERALKASADRQARAAGRPTVSVGGRMFLDWAWFNENSASRAAFGDAQDATFFRATRLHAEGDLFDVFGYKVEMDFAGRDNADEQLTVFKDVYLGIKDLPYLGTVRVGHFKEPFSLEELTSQRFITFMERSLPDILVPARNVGAMAINHTQTENATWAFGVFRQMGDAPPFRQDDDGGTAFTARATWLAWYDQASGGAGLLHLGVGYRYLDFDDPVQRIRQRPEIGIGPRVVDTGWFGDNVDAHYFGPEIALVYGPFSVQAEWVAAHYDRTGGAAEADFNGMYIYVSYFLTGEHRVYRRSEGRFDRVRPYENFFRVRTGEGSIATGRGAWEVAYRYSNLDLHDIEAAVLGGYAADHTFGVNWYLNPNMRIMLNYIHTNASLNYEAPLDIFAMRAQFDF